MIEIKAKDLRQALRDYKACVYDKEKCENNDLYFTVNKNTLSIIGTCNTTTQEYYHNSTFSLNEDIDIIKQDNNGKARFYVQFDTVYTLLENMKLNDINRAYLEYDDNNLIIDIDGENKTIIPLRKYEFSINADYEHKETVACIENIDYDRFIDFLKCYKETCKSKIVVEKFFIDIRDRIINYVGTNNVALVTMAGQLVNNDINTTIEFPYQISKILTSLKRNIHAADFIIKDKYFGIRCKNITMVMFNENMHGKICSYVDLYKHIQVQKTIFLRGSIFNDIYSSIKDNKSLITNAARIKLQADKRYLNVTLYPYGCSENKIETRIAGNIEEEFEYWSSMLYFLDIIKFLKKKEYENINIKTNIYEIGYIEFKIQDIKLLVSDCQHL